MKPHLTSNHDLVLKLKRFSANNRISPSSSSFGSFTGAFPSVPILTTITDELHLLDMMVTWKLKKGFCTKPVKWAQIWELQLKNVRSTSGSVPRTKLLVDFKRSVLHCTYKSYGLYFLVRFVDWHEIIQSNFVHFSVMGFVWTTGCLHLVVTITLFNCNIILLHYITCTVLPMDTTNKKTTTHHVHELQYF